MRIQRILVGAALLMLCAAAAYAQVTISSTPVTTVIATGRAEVAGTVRVTAQNTTVADTFTIRYGGLSIVNAASGATGVAIVNGAWDTAPTIVSVDNANGIVTITVPATAGVGDFFELSNVRVDISVLGGSQSISATLGTLVTPIVAGQNAAVVINGNAAGLSAAATGTTAVALANQTIITSPAVWTLTEGFAAAWKTLAQAGGAAATQGVNIRLTCTGLPTGVTLAITTDATTSTTLTPAYSATSLSSTVTQSVVSFTATDQSVVEKLVLDFTPAFGSTAVNPQPAGSYLVYASLDPVQVALTSTGAIPTSPVFPKFAEVKLPTAGFTALTVTPNTTNFIIPYVTTALGYDTGIAIANTTTDPFAIGSALKQNGSVTITFYGNDGTTVTYNSATDTAKGTGLTAGVLNTGSTWTVLASELLSAKGRTTPLSGYAVVVLNATNGHGQSYVSNFTGFTSGSPLLVLSNPAIPANYRSTVSTEQTSH